jgi:KDO2-lipid IV(A) lauroyltransferase
MLHLMQWLSRLPYGLLYMISNLLAFLARRVLGYRKKVIRGNLLNSFPNQDQSWISQVEKGYYRHFADITVESIKHFSIAESEAMRRMRHEKTELFQTYYKAGKSVLIAGGHFNNWELYALTAHQNIPHDVMGIYKKLSDPVMDDAMRNSRQRFGLEMVRTVDSQQWMEEHMAGQSPKAIVMGFDQSPSNPAKAWWNTFLSQETAWYYGLEKWAREFNLPVLYGHIKKEKRGFYWTEYELITDDPRSMPEGAILERSLRLLEKDIYDQPEQWLWSHKRWKHQRPAGMELHGQVDVDSQLGYVANSKITINE